MSAAKGPTLARAALLLSVPLAACDGGPKARTEAETLDFAVQDAHIVEDADPADFGGSIDGSVEPKDQGSTADDVGPVADVGAPDASEPPTDAAPPPDASEGPPELCNGEDEDADGEIDEGVANLCGGCGAIPADGCQAWRIDLTQTAEAAQTLNVNRLIGLQGGISSLVERDIDGAHCVFQRSVVPGPDAHLGIVTIASPRIVLTQVPTYDANAGTIRYGNSPDRPSTQVFADGDALDFSAGGGQLVAGFQTTLPAPERVLGVDEADLQGAIDVIRGARAEPATVRWQPAAGPDAGALRFFAGGSRSQFNRAGYRGINHYQLDARLEDDGEFELGPTLSRLSLTDSAIWVYLRRENGRRLIQGPHSVELAAASRAELRASGNLEAQEPATFDLLEPSPDAPRITPGEPLSVRFTPPPGEGPLVVSLIYDDDEANGFRYVGCEVADPASGLLVLPPEATLGWPDREDATRQISLRRDLAIVEVPGPDKGRITYSYSVLLTLDP